MEREEMIRNAAYLFLEHGYKKYTLNELAMQLGIGKATLYKHVGDKEAIITAVLDSRKALFYELLQAERQASKHALEAFFKMRMKVNEVVSIPQQRQNLAELEEVYPHLYKKALKDILEIAHVSFETNYIRGVAEKLFRDEDSTIIGEQYAKLFVDYRLDEKYNKRDILVKKVNDAELLFMKGLLTPKGFEILAQMGED